MANLIELAKQFTQLRTEGKNEELVKMCTDDVTLDHFKDGKHDGIVAYRKYVDENPAPTNTKLEEPTVDGQVVKFVGYARKFMMDWKFIVEMTFTEEGKVKSIKTYRA